MAHVRAILMSRHTKSSRSSFRGGAQPVFPRVAHPAPRLLARAMSTVWKNRDGIGGFRCASMHGFSVTFKWLFETNDDRKENVQGCCSFR